MAMNCRRLERRLAQLRAGGTEQEARVRHYQTMLQTTAMAYFIWARLLFLAIYRSSLNCTARTVAFALCYVSTFAYFVFFLDALLMLYRVEHRFEVICQNQAQLCHRIWISLARQEGNEAEAEDRSSGVEEMMLANSYGGYSRGDVERKVYIYTVLGAFLGVVAVELYAAKFLLCY